MPAFRHCPKTRFKRGCCNTSPEILGERSMSVSPIAGYVPLLVSAQITVNTANVCGGATYTIDYGDGTTPYQIFVPANNCGQISQTLGHTYKNTGNFLLTLSSGLHMTFVTVNVLPR